MVVAPVVVRERWSEVSDDLRGEMSWGDRQGDAGRPGGMPTPSPGALVGSLSGT
jgi:hypothetical protein